MAEASPATEELPRPESGRNSEGQGRGGEDGGSLGRIGSRGRDGLGGEPSWDSQLAGQNSVTILPNLARAYSNRANEV
jgi:hypothetical protein